jgi:hypothetical protein
MACLRNAVFFASDDKVARRVCRKSIPVVYGRCIDQRQNMVTAPTVGSYNARGFRRIFEILDHLVKDAVTAHLGGEQSFDVLHDENRRVVDCQNAQILEVEKQPVISGTYAPVSRASDDRIGLARWAAAKNPILSAFQSTTDSAVYLRGRYRAKFRLPRFIARGVGLRRPGR